MTSTTNPTIRRAATIAPMFFREVSSEPLTCDGCAEEIQPRYFHYYVGNAGLPRDGRYHKRCLGGKDLALVTAAAA
jgi:hypothetical protein